MTTRLAHRTLALVPALLAASAAVTVGAADVASLQAQIDELKKRQTAVEGRSGDAPRLRLVDLSLAVQAVAGTSTERDESIQNLQGGGHDPKQRGFTMPNAELAISGAVDPYFFAQANIITFIDDEGETAVELEEAFIRTQALPYGLEIKAGQFFTEFGRQNQRHPHSWTWIDQPVIMSRVFGGDNMRGQGARLSVALPLSWQSDLLFGAQNARGETMPSFFGEGEGLAGRDYTVETDTRSLGDLMWNGRWSNALDVNDDVTLRLGASFAAGPNASGEDTTTVIWGAHAALRWRPAGGERGFPFVTWELEVIGREAETDEFDDGLNNVYAAETLEDLGLFTQVLVGFHPGWSAGVRLDWASADGETVIFDDPDNPTTSTGDREADPLRDDRLRISPMIAWQPSEFSRLRLQYNYDQADHLEDDDAHSIWLSLDILLGSHPPHVF
jgi:hypothetical protein